MKNVHSGSLNARVEAGWRSHNKQRTWTLEPVGDEMLMKGVSRGAEGKSVSKWCEDRLEGDRTRDGNTHLAISATQA